MTHINETARSGGNRSGPHFRSNSPEPLRWIHYTIGVRLLPTSVRSFVLQRGVWLTPASLAAAPQTRKAAARQESVRLADTVRGAMLDRFDRLVYDDGPIAAMMRDLEEHLVGSGWSAAEIINVLRDELFPEAMKPPADWEKPTKHGLVPRRGGGGASPDRLKAFIELFNANRTPNAKNRLAGKAIPAD